MTPYRVALLIAFSLLAWEFWDIKKRNKVEAGAATAGREATGLRPDSGRAGSRRAAPASLIDGGVEPLLHDGSGSPSVASIRLPAPLDSP